MGDKEKEKSRKPEDTPFKQQRMKAWQPILTPVKVIIIFLVIGIIFVPVGTTLLQASKEIYEKTITYDGDNVDVDCKIKEANANKPCKVTFKISEDVDGPVYVYYSLENFYQNHRRYVKSRSSLQLQGEDLKQSEVSADCEPLYKNHSLLLNPCGLIANSLFNDIISLNNPDYTLDEKGISWLSDRKVKFKNVNGFRKQSVDSSSVTCQEAFDSSKYADCRDYYDEPTNTSWKYWYPNDENTQYLYESYPMIVSPIEGVENEHFIVWMRTAGLPTFRKLYGKIHSSLKKGDQLEFNIIANFEVDSFGGSKSLVLSNLGEFGGKNSFLGVSYIVVGSISLLLGFLFALKQLISPRQLGDTRYLGWNT